MTPAPHHPPRLRRWLDGAFALLLALGVALALRRYGHCMDGYEQAILLASAPALAALGWHWRALQGFALAVAALALLAIGQYHVGGQPDLARADSAPLLRYALSSQSAIVWMGLLYLLSALFYWLGLLARSRWHGAAALGAKLAWAGSAMALTGALVRWFESYLLGANLGYIPVSNLYEVLVLFCWITTLFMLYYEAQFGTRSLGPLVMPIVCAAVGFLLWYALARQGHLIQPLAPALQSWWMKLHVPANLIGYGAFAIAAAMGFAWLLQQQAHPHANRPRWRQRLPLGLLWLLGVGLCCAPLLLRRSPNADVRFWLAYCGIAALAVAAALALRHRIAAALPAPDALQELMHKAIATGFAFFTLATVLGALWAAQAWGSYWSWDPKETWALIVWLNYAAWLHMRLVRGWRGSALAWWALLGLLVTSFAFLGVNLLLPGLHSYGQL
ncbi:c-type cytochrome biogenesis protein CcsB [Allofranklinella schreckenbergeri]|uniref:C-type cytochrome biogenesis protein CcsB n=1 Tax=Allofranklinella schreckenbergeri TaxID=1076744 RepID=A0A3M6Q2Y5_9BURK|nr:c-type cytochrome biogenesis protein CcsB [Allofranklinella schreckenbergeri]RMW96910.1 c-type cytochrome biogenesis protein CcsB [Allofranklinella schreckenbergeri]